MHHAAIETMPYPPSSGSNAARRRLYGPQIASRTPIARSRRPQELTERSPGNSIDKQTFLMAFPWPGLLGGERPSRCVRRR